MPFYDRMTEVHPYIDYAAVRFGYKIGLGINMMDRTFRMLPMVVVATITLTANTAFAQSPTAPVMNEELMTRLIKYTRALPEEGEMIPKLCTVFDLCDGTKGLPLKIAESDKNADGRYLFGLPLDPNSKDILIMVNQPKIAYAYLTDKIGRLRAAAISDANGVHLITNEEAAEKFKAALTLFAGEATALPPTK